MVLNGKNVSKFHEDFIKNYDEDSDKGCTLEVDVQYLKSLLSLHDDFPFFTKRKKIKKCNKLACGRYIE